MKFCHVRRYNDKSYVKGPIIVRADAGGAIGTGHVMRMLALAQVWVENGGWQMADGESADNDKEVVFICAQLPKSLEARLREEGFAVVRIDAEPGSEADVRETLAFLGSRFSVVGSRAPVTNHRPPTSDHWLVLDGYHFGYDYQKAIKEFGLRLLCVDDHGYSDRWYCDAILNQNLDAEKRINYQTELPDTKLLLGATFCLLRREFLQAQRPVKEWGRIQSLLVTLGGSDPGNATGAVLQLLHQACPRPLDIRVLLGSDSQHMEVIQAFESHHRIEVLQGVSNMSEQYAWADGIISAGGSTCWEWLYFGLLGAIVTIAENQLPIVNALTEMREAALCLGWVREFDQKKIAGILESWFDSPTLKVKQMAAHSLIDGVGGLRVVDFLTGRSSNQHAE